MRYNVYNQYCLTAFSDLACIDIVLIQCLCNDMQIEEKKTHEE